MRVVLRAANQFGESGPKPGDSGESLYFQYDDDGDLILAVLFYGYPGIFYCYPGMVECVGEDAIARL